MTLKYAGKVNAPEFPEGLDWLNVPEPVRMSDLRGKLVVLDFWTYCCINCMHILPKLKKLEEKYRDSLVVIGIHSAKFDAEKATDNIKEAVARYDVIHPVLNDKESRVWQGYGVKAWPTLMFIDPEGKVIGRHEGEFPLDGLERVFQQMLDEFEQRKILNHDLLPFQEHAIEEAKRPLAYPGKIEVDSGRLLIADSNHHRVLVASLDGEVTTVIGKGESGNADGGFDDAVFDNPQGMAANGEVIYVADAGSHTIKRVDLAERTVKSIAGTGQQSLYRHEGGEARSYPLNSPYDVALRGKTLYIAMAGFHQLWSLDLESDMIAPFAGDGGEALKDGLRMEAKLAQPYGIAVQNGNVFFADSETSSVRVAKVGKDGRVVTLVGMGLFDYGDRDGIGKEALLQHVQGVAVGPDVVFLADTFNHRVKSMSLATLRVSRLAGSGKKGAVDGPLSAASFNEPAGLAYADGKVYVADTNNHAIRVIDLESSEVRTLELRGL